MAKTLSKKVNQKHWSALYESENEKRKNEILASNIGKIIGDDTFDSKVLAEKVLDDLKKDKLIEDAKNGIWPDKSDFCRCVVDGLIKCPDFHYDAPAIIKNYLSVKYDECKEYFDNNFKLDNYKKIGPDTQIIIDFFQMILNKALENDEYSRLFLIQVYKTYYKKDYDWLKRFKILNMDDLLANFDDDSTGMSYSIAITMAGFMGIELKPEFAVIFDLFNKKKKDSKYGFELKYAKSEKLTDDELEIAEKQLNDMSDQECKFEYINAVKDTIKSFLSVYGVDESYFSICNGYYADAIPNDTSMIFVLATLRRKFPDKEYTINQLKLCTYIHSLIAMFFQTTKNLSELYYSGLGLAYDDEDALWKEYTNIPKKNKHCKDETIAVEDEKEDTVKCLESQIESLQNELDKKDENINELWNDVRLLKKDIESKNEEIEELKENQYEVSRLRNYVYNMTEKEEDDTIEEVSLDEIKSVLKNMNVVIVGGRPYWHTKLKKMFSKWNFFDSDRDITVAKDTLLKSDIIIFYTKYLAHSNCKKVMNIVRSNDLNIGYVNTVNVEKSLFQIYDDAVNEGVV